MGISPSIAAPPGGYAAVRPASADVGKPALVADFANSSARSDFPTRQAGLAHTSTTELPKALAARMSVESVDGIELDHIPFVGDAAVLIDDLPAPKAPEDIPPATAAKPQAEAEGPPKPEEEIKDPVSPDSKLAQAAAQAYLMGREVAGQAPAAQPLISADQQVTVAPPAKV